MYELGKGERKLEQLKNECKSKGNNRHFFALNKINMAKKAVK